MHPPKAVSTVESSKRTRKSIRSCSLQLPLHQGQLVPDIGVCSRACGERLQCPRC
eukprot:01414_4